MPTFSAVSLERLATCHPDLQQVCRGAIAIVDFRVLVGHRGQAEQDAAYHDGKSDKPWPESKHNLDPAEAVDLAPYPIDWEDREAFFYLAGVIRAVAAQLGVRIVWGGKWKRRQDLPHFELVTS